MAEEISNAVSLLQHEYLFKGLDPEDIQGILSRFQSITLEHNTVVFSQGSPADSFYILLFGTVRITKWVKDKETLLSTIGRGEYFGEQGILNDQPRFVSATTISRCRLLRLDQSQFQTLLDEYPVLQENIQAIAESRYLALQKQFDWLETDEVVELVSRKHDFFLFISLIGPIILLILSFPVLAMAITRAADPLFFDILVILAGLMIFTSIGWGIWNWVDWGNDYYVVTNQRVVWIEKVVALYDSRREAPLEQILTLNMFSSQLGRIFDYGDVSLRTFTGGIVMRKMKNPELFISFIEKGKQKAKQQNLEEDARAVHETLERAKFGDNPVTSRASVTAKAVPQKPRKIPPPGSLEEALQTFLKVRMESHGTITYRKHWFLLAQKSWLELIVIGGSVTFTIYLLGRVILENIPFLEFRFLWLILILLVFGSFIVLVYHFLDWSNDIYRLTPDQILDIEKKPLGMEVKKTANLESVMTIEHERTNLLGILLNFGTVRVMIGQTPFLFFGVHNPDQVHADVADFREALIRRKRNVEAERERNKLALWFATNQHLDEAMRDYEKFLDEQ